MARLSGAALLALAGCASAPPPEPSVLAVDAHAALAAAELVLVDVRPAEERLRDGAPLGAVAIEYARGPFAARERFVERVAAAAGGRAGPVAVICRHGVTSRSAQAILTDAGFVRVVNVSDGFLGSEAGPGWRGWGLPLARD